MVDDDDDVVVVVVRTSSCQKWERRVQLVEFDLVFLPT